MPAELRHGLPDGLPAELAQGSGDGPADELTDELAFLAAAVDRLAAQQLDGLSDHALAQRVLALRWLLDRLEGRWLAELAAVDGRGAAGADQSIPAVSTAGWLRHRLGLGAGTATSALGTARALVRGPLTQTPQASPPAASCRSPMPPCWPPAPRTCPPPRHGRRTGAAGGRPAAGPASPGGA